MMRLNIKMAKRVTVPQCAILGMALMMTACVTINIYFPAAEAQKAADKIIDEVWQLKQNQSKKDPNAVQQIPTDESGSAGEKSTQPDVKP